MAAKTDLPTGQDDPQGANAWRGSVKMSMFGSRPEAALTVWNVGTP